MRAAGHRIVYTPYARLTHREQENTREPLRRDEARFRQRWSAVLNRDPYYNPNLCSQHADYRLGP